MQTTTNYGLKKPDGIDVVDIENFNYNSDIIDTELAKRALKTEIPTVPVKSVNGRIGAVTISKSDVGLGNVNNWGATTAINSTSTTTYATASAVKQAYDKAVEASDTANTKQNSTDNSLTTTSKTIVGAINELDKELSVLASSSPSIVKSLQRGAIALTYNSTYSGYKSKVEISAVDLKKSIVIVSSNSPRDDIGVSGQYYGARCTLFDSYIMVSSSGPTEVTWEVIEFY